MARAWDKHRVARAGRYASRLALDTFLYCARAVLAEFRRFAIPWGGVLLGSMSTRQIRGGKERGRSAKAGRAVCAHGVPWIRYSMRVRGSGSVNQILSCPTHGILPCAQLVAGWAPLADRILNTTVIGTVGRLWAERLPARLLQLSTVCVTTAGKKTLATCLQIWIWQL